MQAPIKCYSGLFLSIFKLCLATTGVCVFLMRLLRWAHFLLSANDFSGRRKVYLRECGRWECTYNFKDLKKGTKEMKKKIFGILIVMCMIISAIGAVAVSAEPTAGGMCGENVLWSFENGTLIISGTGDMRDYEGMVYNSETRTSYEEWPEYRELRDEITNIIVEEGVTSLGAYAFHGLNEAKSISLPSTLTIIKNHVFTFTGIEELDIPDNVKSVGIYSISDSITVLKIGKGLETLDGAIRFNHDNGFKEIIVDEENEYFSSADGNLFNKDKTKFIMYAAQNEREEYTVPSTVQVICNGAFERCKNLKRIILPEGLKCIGSDAFYASWSMENVNIPNSVEKLYVDCFEYGVSGVNLKYTYDGTKEQFKQIKVMSRDYIGIENGNEIYEEVDGVLPEGDKCVEIIYSPVIKVLLNGEKINFDVQPQIIDDRTMVPMRAIFEALGAKVEWIEHDEYRKEIKATKDGKTIVLWIGEIVMSIENADGSEHEEIILDVPPAIVDSRTLVPVRAVSEALDCKVDWNGENREVLIVK